MKKFIFILAVMLAVSGIILILYRSQEKETPPTENRGGYCLTGAFIADAPSKTDILDFKNSYGKKPYYILVFLDWGKYPPAETINAILAKECCPLITWEPWEAIAKKGIDYDGLLRGEYDSYIAGFAGRIKEFRNDIYLRFAHEMNGNWYPWSGSRIGADKYKKIYRHVKDIFDKEGARNVKWIFSVNWEDVPSIKGNDFLNYYPGETYVDYTGIDGYNWGNTQSWSRWMSFGELFEKAYRKVVQSFKKPVIISEFGSASSGGDKTEWIRDAMRDIKEWKDIKGFALFNVNKEVDWRFPVYEASGMELRNQLRDPYFKDHR